MTATFYSGHVMHRRLHPRRHVLRYRTFQWLLDLDTMDQDVARCRLISRNRFNILSFRDRDFGDGSDVPLRQQIITHLHAAGLTAPVGRVQILCMPRLLGYVFNPISCYFCHDADGRLMAIVHEVRNTFGEKHSYVIPVCDSAPHVVRQTCHKRFHVSPFMDMDMRYDFRIIPPGERVGVHITCVQDGRVMLHAAFVGQQRAFSDAQVMALVASHPLMTLKVMAAIHWEALWIWLKGIAYRRKPHPVTPPVTYVSKG